MQTQAAGAFLFSVPTLLAVSIQQLAAAKGPQSSPIFFHCTNS
jgi:hypothetical protein